MFPIGDDNSARRSLPVVTYALIALNVLFFFVELSGGNAFIQQWAFIPRRFGQDPAGGIPTIFTAMFMHAGWLHLGGNMLYLWIFGDNVEDTVGHGRFLLFYLAAGVAAALAQVMLNPSSRVPMVGASGAVSGVLGAYLLLFPYARVLTLLIIGFFVRFVHVPAMIVLGFWIVLQLLNGFITFSAQSMGRGESGGVAWFAHIGGFLAGMLLLLMLRPRRSSRL